MRKYIIMTSAILLIISVYLFFEQAKKTTYGEVVNAQIEQEAVEEVTILYNHILEDVSFSNISDKDNIGYVESITITDMYDIDRIMKEPSDMKMKRGEGPMFGADYRIRLISGQHSTTLFLNADYMSDGEHIYRISGENELWDIIDSLDYEWERTEF